MWYNRDTMDRASFAQSVRDLFVHLDDSPYLRGHPLAKLLAAPGEQGSPEALRRVLVDVIEELRPSDPILPRSRGWRRYRYLRRRYVEGVDPDQIAHELGLSPRQCRREHVVAVETVASLLWKRLPAPSEDGGAHPLLETPPPDETPPSADAALALESELKRAAFEQPKEDTSAQDVLGGVLRTISSLAASRGAKVELSADEQLAPVTVQRIVLRQILLSLLSYAIGLHEQARIDVTATNAAHAVEVRVTASGRGDGRATVELDSARIAGVDEIAVARRLAETQGAALQVDSTGDAVTFRLTLPSARTATVLVIDDNPDVARLVQRYLVGTSYRLIQARTGAGALRQAQAARPDAIILDVLLPAEDGWEVLEALKSDPGTRDIPVVVCSVLPDRLLALSLGVVDFLPKPITQPALLAALERCRELAPRGGNPEPLSRNA